MAALEAQARRGHHRRCRASWSRGEHDGAAIVVDPFHVGSSSGGGRRGSWRAACAELSRRRFDLVQSHERIDCCDVYRAGDGVHAEWLEQRARVQSPLARASRRA